MRDEFKTNRLDWNLRYAAERSYICRILRAMKSREVYTVKALAIITKVPKQKIYQRLKVLVGCGVVEKLEEVIEYPEWYSYAGTSARRTWRKENNINHRGRTPTRWRRR